MIPQAHSKSSNCESDHTINLIKPDHSQRRLCYLCRAESALSRPRTLDLNLNNGPGGQIKDDDHEDVLPI